MNPRRNDSRASSLRAQLRLGTTEDGYELKVQVKTTLGAFVTATRETRRRDD